MDCLDAIRGLASLAVVVGHFILGFWPAIYYRAGDGWDQLPAGVQAFAHFPGKFFWEGERAVAIFFVLSGFVLSLAFFQKGAAAALGSAAARRYPRLMLPAAASVLLAYVLLKLGAIYCQEAVTFLNDTSGFKHSWLQFYYNFSPDFLAAFREGIWGTFTTGSKYNLVLWTMSIELTGSFLVYAFLALFGSLRNRWILYGVCGTVLVAYEQTYFLEFFMGMALCDLWVHNQRTWQLFLPTGAACALIALALFVVRWKCLTAFLIIAAAAASPGIQAALRARWLAALGRISFALYLVHMPIFCSLGCGLQLLMCRDLGWRHSTGADLAAMAALFGSLVTAWVFYRCVDLPTISLTRKLDGWLFRPKRRGETVRPLVIWSRAA